MIRFSFGLFLFFIFHQAFCQLPASQLFSCEFIELANDLRLKNFRYLSGFNPDGYNNQPSFIKDGRVIISSNYNSELTDVLNLNIEEYKLKRWTATSRSGEYSPQPMPDGNHFSVVRQEGTDQYLWAYPFDLSSGGFNILPDFNDIGYYCWLNNEMVAVYRVTEPNTLSIINTTTGHHEDLVNDVGRCLKLDDSGILYFVHKVTEDFWYIKSYDPATEKMVIITEIPVEDFEILKSGTIITSFDGQLLKLATSDNKWTPFYNLEDLGLKSVSRITSYRNKLIIVGE